MRVSLRNQYSNFLFNLQDTQSRLMELNKQASSQKRINTPSDDAVGTAKVLNYRGSLSAITQYQSNIDTATGWLNLADETMLQVSTILSSLKGLAEQGATGTMTASDREATSYQVRQLFSQLVSLSNTQFEGSSIFAGHKTAGNAFEEGLMVYDEDGNNMGQATGMSSRSVLVQFLGDEGTTARVGTDSIDYRYTSDGGTTWKTGTLGTSAPFELDLDGVGVTLREDYQVELTPVSNTSISSGSWLTVAPTAIYLGDHETQSAVTYGAPNPAFTALPLGGFTGDVDVTLPAGVTFGSGTDFDVDITVDGQTWTVTVDNSTTTPVVSTPYGGIQLSGTPSAQTFNVVAGATGVQSFGSDVNAVGRGVFGGDVIVRIDNSTTIGSGTAVEYSYSTDGGVNWSSGHTAANASSPAELLVPGGKLALTARGASTSLAQGAQFTIHPQTASHDLEISAGEFLKINNIGSDIFGGYHFGGSEPVFADSEEARNIFVAVGKLVAALENNSQQGCAEALEDLKTSQEYFSTQLASVGARENRLEVAGTVLSGLKLNETERMSNIEDVDLASLLTDLANQQLAYETVLKSSSMIMKMSLVNYL